ncbi:glycoside hydrolase family 61 protein [Laccaria bicolor S238N-H82]|uniref:lytic cellulose monooxygenase (C4-dehydrogenating) n=1 Tax=Laccaria bicolor (strain S238N-H82 / ATCC MYA-4686) TaxID=486041 RepID=B0DF61_LACBS|nr:glycoside hydrolase family 61 protein [Laccaria bicolor S238N-H82]EDR06657.1 glycoside hydrolase family 61 protein [Laccaria bicolor S238N-H82]|eukprot:XP_001882504.1 glycoside hydrolase family 61 protein [Laccaria bicolor S238N-H82]
MSFAQPGQAQTCGSAACVEKGSSQQESQVSGPLGPSSVVNQPASSQRRPGQPVSLNEQAQMRVAALRGRIQGRQNRTGVEFGTGNTTGSLLHHEHGGGEPGEAKLIVGWQARSYLTRHEIIALHLAKSLGGAEFYPACSQLMVGASGTGVPDPLGGHLPGACSDNDPGIFDSQVFDACAPYIHLPRSSCRCICERWHFHSWKRNHDRIFKGNGNPDRWCHWDIDDV